MYVLLVIPLNSFFLNVEPSFQYKCVTKKKEFMIIEKYRNPISVSCLDSFFFETHTTFVAYRSKWKGKKFSLQVFVTHATFKNILKI